MKKFLIYIFICSMLQGLALADTAEDIDIQVNSLYAANKLDDAFNRIIEIPQDERTAQQWLIMGNIMLDYGRKDDAEFMYNSALTVDPKFYKAYYNLGNIYLNSDKPYMAIENYKYALKYNKGFAPAHYNLGCAYIKTADLKKAKNAFLDAIFYNPNVADYHFNLAYVYKKLGKEKDAKEYLGYYNKLMNNN